MELSEILCGLLKSLDNLLVQLGFTEQTLINLIPTKPEAVALVLSLACGKTRRYLDDELNLLGLDQLRPAHSTLGQCLMCNTIDMQGEADVHKRRVYYSR